VFRKVAYTKYPSLYRTWTLITTVHVAWLWRKYSPILMTMLHNMIKNMNHTFHLSRKKTSNLHIINNFLKIIDRHVFIKSNVSVIGPCFRPQVKCLLGWVQSTELVPTSGPIARLTGRQGTSLVHYPHCAMRDWTPKVRNRYQKIKTKKYKMYINRRVRQGIVMK
jgi:hypothetical protein